MPGSLVGCTNMPASRRCHLTKQVARGNEQAITHQGWSYRSTGRAEATQVRGRCLKGAQPVLPRHEAQLRSRYFDEGRKRRPMLLATGPAVTMRHVVNRRIHFIPNGSAKAGASNHPRSINWAPWRCRSETARGRVACRYSRKKGRASVDSVGRRSSLP